MKFDDRKKYFEPLYKTLKQGLFKAKKTQNNTQDDLKENLKKDFKLKNSRFLVFSRKLIFKALFYYTILKCVLVYLQLIFYEYEFFSFPVIMLILELIVSYFLRKTRIKLIPNQLEGFSTEGYHEELKIIYFYLFSIEENYIIYYLNTISINNFILSLVM